MCGDGHLKGFAALRFFALRECLRCRSLSAWPRPAVQDLLGLHDSDEYFDHPYFEQRRSDAHRISERCGRIGARLGPDAVASIRGESHLDIGCDTGGLLLAAARMFGTRPVGIDIAGRAVALARKAGLEVYRSDLDGVPQLEGFALITIVDVLEHVPDPRRFLAEVARRMRPGGWCYLETPNIGSVVYQVGRQVTNLTGGRPRWLCERLFLPEHVQYISHAGFDCLAAAAGLRIVARGQAPLGFADVNSALPVQLAVATLQLADRLAGTELLHWLVLQKPTDVVAD